MIDALGSSGLHMSYSFKLLKGAYIGHYMGGGEWFRGDTKRASRDRLRSGHRHLEANMKPSKRTKEGPRVLETGLGGL